MKTSDDFKQALLDKKVPILVLDQKWHRLFAIHGKTDEIKKVEGELNSLLAEQGKCNQELKDLKKLKSQLMSDIVLNMNDSQNIKEEEIRERKLEDNKRLIDEINEKIESCEDRILELPAEIKKTNETLMILSMDYFYEKLRVNHEESKEIEEWITQIRIDLKKNIIRKQNRDINNREIYSYLHDIFGFDVLNIFDIQYGEYFKDEKQGDS
ncbi:MAG: hypothetical protein UIC64_01365 [Agathobacter sp.]|nr:hypothetical protein [Agathobacter sp.]